MIPVNVSFSSSPLKALFLFDFSVAERPIDVPLACSPIGDFFQSFRFRAFVRCGSRLVLVDEGADFSARIFERVGQRCALFVEQSDLLGDLIVLRLRRFLQLVNFRGERFVFGGRVDGRFGFLLVPYCFIEIFGIGVCETALVIAPRAQAVEFIPEATKPPSASEELTEIRSSNG